MTLIHVLTLYLILKICITHHQKRDYRNSPPEWTELTKLTQILMEVQCSLSTPVFQERIKSIERGIAVIKQFKFHIN
jgi:hypothetical protein